jgi:thiol-disulfide isomerase/thioredoxin
MNKKIFSLFPLMIAGWFMLAGIMFLVWLGRDQSRILDVPMGPLDLQPLLVATEPVNPEAWKDHVVVLHFWGTWCAPCRKEYPEFAKLYERLKNDERIQFISVSCSPGIEKDVAKLKSDTSDYLRSIQVDMPVYADTTAFTRSYIAKLLASQGMGYPTTLVIDRNGIIRDAWVGAADITKLEAKIVEIASQPNAGA